MRYSALIIPYDTNILYNNIYCDELHNISNAGALGKNGVEHSTPRIEIIAFQQTSGAIIKEVAKHNLFKTFGCCDYFQGSRLTHGHVGVGLYVDNGGGGNVTHTKLLAAATVLFARGPVSV